MDSCIKLPLDADLLNETVVNAKDHAISNGVLLRTREHTDSPDVATYVPFTLLPSPVPRACFEHATRVQLDLNLLMHRAAHDYEFMKECLYSTVKVDEFTRRMWGIYETILKEGITQPVCLGMHRSDYMIQQDSNQNGYNIRQIEFNTIAAGMGGMVTHLSLCHRYVLDTLGHCDVADRLPVNKANQGLAESVVTACREYGNPQAAVLFLVFDVEMNSYDQRRLEYGIKDINRNIKVIRRSLQYAASKGRLGPNKELILDGTEIAVIYMRAGYSPRDYTCEQDWEGRLMMERSKAICCPNVYYQLVGTKKVQQVLAQPGVVERFISDPAAVVRIRSTFAGLYTLDIGEEGDKSVEMAMKDPDKYVLKPQREGGGNNLYGEDIRAALERTKGSEDRTAYILMDRVVPVPFKNYALMAGKPVQLLDMVTEMGIMGTLVGTKDLVIHNKGDGHMLRSKPVGIDEGGIYRGFSVLDTAFLLD